MWKAKVGVKAPALPLSPRRSGSSVGKYTRERREGGGVGAWSGVGN